MMRLLCLIFSMFIFNNRDLHAKDYFYLRNVEQCFIKRLEGKKIINVQKEKFINIPLKDITQSLDNPNFVTFKLRNKTYIASTQCLYLATSENPEIMDNHKIQEMVGGEFEEQRYLMEIGGGTLKISDQNKNPETYSFLKSAAGNPIVSNTLTKSSYETQILYSVGFGIEKFENWYLTFKARGFKGKKTDTVSTTNSTINVSLVGELYYSDSITNYYVGFKHLFQNSSKWIPTLSCYLGYSHGNTILSYGTDSYLFTSDAIAGIGEVGLEYLITSRYAIGLNLGYEFLGSRLLKAEDKTHTSNIHTALNYSNLSGMIGIISYF